jgi:anti-sigma-K factor RskA
MEHEESSAYLPLTRSEMEAHLPGYVMNELAADDREEFEASLKAYPDIAAELAEMQEAFALLAAEPALQELKHKRDRAITQRVRNLSVHVQERMAQDRKRERRRAMFWRWAIPVAAAGSAVAVLMLADPITSEFSASLTQATQAETTAETMSAELLRPEEARLLQSDTTTSDGITEADVSFKDNTAAMPGSQEIDQKETLAASRMLKRETMRELSLATLSPFTDAFAGETALLQTLDDGDVDDEDVVALLKDIL